MFALNDAASAAFGTAAGAITPDGSAGAVAGAVAFAGTAAGASDNIIDS